MVKRAAALPLDLGVPRDRAFGHPCPDYVPAEDVIDAPVVVVAPKDVVMVSAHRRLVRPDQRDGVRLHGEVSPGGGADHALADHGLDHHDHS